MAEIIASQPFEAEFLWIFDKSEELAKEIQNKIENLLRNGVRTRQIEVDAIRPEEKVALERINELMDLIGICEAGEEDIKKTIIHELKWILGIINSHRPCLVCGEIYMPMKALPYFICPKCGTKFVSKTYFPDESQAQMWIDQVLAQERREDRDALYCPFCIKGRIEKNGETYIYFEKMEPKIEVSINQYKLYPKQYLLIHTICRECGYEDMRWFPAEDKKVIPYRAREYERFKRKTATCPRCGGDNIDLKETVKEAGEITEDDRYLYSLPYKYRGSVVPVPPKEISGVDRRYYYDIYRLEEPCIVTPINMEYTDRMALQELLDSFELNIKKKDVSLRLYNRIREYVSSLEENITRDRTYIFKYPDIALVDMDTLKEISRLSGQFIGLLDVILRAYMREFVMEHGHEVLTPLRIYKTRLKELNSYINYASPNSPTLQAPIDQITNTLHDMNNTIPQLIGLAEGIKGAVCDYAVIRRREIEILRENYRALREAGLTKFITESIDITEEVLAILHGERKPMSPEEIARILGIDEKIVRDALRTLMREGKVRRRGKEYGV